MLATIYILTVIVCIGMVELAVLQSDVIEFVNEVITGAVNTYHNCCLSIPSFIYVYVPR